MKKICLVCKKEFIRKLGTSISYWNKRKFCSHNCYSVSKLGMLAWNKGKPAPWAVGNKNGLGHIPWNKNKKGIHLSSKSEFKKGVEHPMYKGGTAKCLDCGKALTHYDRKRCQKCYGITLKSKIGILAPRWAGGVPDCIDCGKKLTSKKSRRCLPCRIIWQRGENSPNWKNGLSENPYPKEFNAELKLKIRTRDDFICCLCDRTEREELEELNRVLCVNHKNFNKDDCREENLNTLCLRCNVKINREREYWTNYFNIKNYD